MNQDLLIATIDNVMPEALATGLFTSTCTFLQPSGNVISGGAPDGTYVPVPGLPANIPCMMAPNSSARIQATEIRALEEITTFRLQHLLLNGWYPAVRGGSALGWIVAIEGENWTLMGAEDDSQGQMTRCEVRLAQQ